MFADLSHLLHRVLMNKVHAAQLNSIATVIPPPASSDNASSASTMHDAPNQIQALSINGNWQQRRGKLFCVFTHRSELPTTLVLVLAVDMQAPRIPKRSSSSSIAEC